VVRFKLDMEDIHTAVAHFYLLKVASTLNYIFLPITLPTALTTTLTDPAQVHLPNIELKIITMAGYVDYVGMANFVRPYLNNFKLTYSLLRAFETVIQTIVQQHDVQQSTAPEDIHDHLKAFVYSLFEVADPLDAPNLRLVQSSAIHIRDRTGEVRKQIRARIWLIRSAMHGDRVGNVLPPLAHYLTLLQPIISKSQQYLRSPITQDY
jgi:hypothetical protein